MFEILRVIPVFFLLIIGFACYFLVLGAFFPRRTTKTMNVVQQMPGRSFGIGLVNFLFFGTITFVMFGIADTFQESGNNILNLILLIPTLLLTGALLSLLFVGLTALSNLLGERLFPELTQWRKTFWGTVVLGVASSIPAVGWGLLFPLIALTGFGAVILGFFQRDAS
jgi:hypothetical protein